MFTKEQLEFLKLVITSTQPNGQPFVTVGIKDAKLAADTFSELETQLQKLADP